MFYLSGYQGNVYEFTTGIISIGIFFISGILIHIIKKKKLDKVIANQFIIQLTISEMINNLNSFFIIVFNSIGTKQEKYSERMRVCYSQMFTGLFSNFYTLSSSFLIAFRIYDVLYNNSKIFKKPNNVRKAKLFSFYVSVLLSYVIWMIQMSKFQTYKYSSVFYFKIISCSVGFEMDIVVIILYILFILAISFFSIKSIIFMKQFKERLAENDEPLYEEEDVEGNEDQIKKAKKIQKHLILFPLITFILFTMLVIEKLLALTIKNGTESQKTVIIICYVLYVISSVLRGIIFVLVYLFTHDFFREVFIELICCSKCKNSNNDNQIDNKSTTSLVPIHEI